jgi:hypothetical protein
MRMFDERVASSITIDRELAGVYGHPTALTFPSPPYTHERVARHNVMIVPSRGGAITVTARTAEGSGLALVQTALQIRWLLEHVDGPCDHEAEQCKRDGRLYEHRVFGPVAERQHVGGAEPGGVREAQM